MKAIEMKKVLAGFLALCALFTGQAFALVDPAITTAITDLSADAVTIMTSVLGGIVLVLGIIVGIRLLKRGVRQF